MKKAKRLLAFVLAIAVLCSGITESSINSRAAAKKPGKAKIASLKQAVDGSIVLTAKSMKNIDWYIVYRSEQPNSGFKEIGRIWDGQECRYIDNNADRITTYYYKIRACRYVDNGKKATCGVIPKGSLKKGAFSDVKSIEHRFMIQTNAINENTVQITIPPIENVTKYDIYRSTSKSEGFTLLASKEEPGIYRDKTAELGVQYYYKVIANEYEEVEVEVTTTEAPTTERPLTTTEAPTTEKPITTTEEPTTEPGTTTEEPEASGDAQEADSNIYMMSFGDDYWYSGANTEPETVIESRLKASYESNVVLGMSGPSAIKISEIKVAGVSTLSVKWNKYKNASGYFLYKKQYDGSYKQIKKISSGGKTSCRINVPHGEEVYLVIVPYINMNNLIIRGAYSKEKRGLMNYYSCDKETEEERSQRIFGKNRLQKYSSAGKAAKNMKTIRIKVWDFKSGSSGPKVTRYYNLTVHKNIAPSVKKIFEEIYKGKEKFPIHSIGGYSFRSGQHGVGLAMDINPNENYQIKDGEVLVGKLYKPGKNPYSIPQDGEVARIMKKYGFYQGIWSSSQDYMHFSYYGI